MGLFWWALVASAIALTIALDLRRLHLSRVGLPTLGWVIASLILGPMIIPVYRIQRRRAYGEMLDVVWQFVGDSTYPVERRRERLVALHAQGLVSTALLATCLESIELESAGSSISNDRPTP